MDALSHLLRVVRLVGAVFVQGKFTAPWSYQSPAAHLAAPLLEPGAERVVIFHLVTQGSCHAMLDGMAPVQLAAGDVVILPHGDAHGMASDPAAAGGMAAVQLDRLLARRPRLLSYGGGGAPTDLVCGYLACDARLARMLLAGLPPLVRVNVRGTSAGRWLEGSIRYALDEAVASRPGGAGVLAKLSEVLFIEGLRLYMDAQPPGRTGWLAAVGDRVVGSALQALHEQPASQWTVDALAQRAGASRSVLAARFLHLVGSPPMHYLTQWRMLLAANLLTASNAPLARIAQDVGYQTDAAFSRAFRREYGAPPAAWRRERVAPL